VKRVRGQVSIEYISIVALVLVLTVPLLLIFYDKTTETKSSINMNQANQIAKKIADNAENVYFLGTDSMTTIKLFFPENIQKITIQNNEVVITVKEVDRISDIVAYTPINITGNLSTYHGNHHVIVQSKGTYVEVTE
jgi:uncharacterized protein (UPF0333 family)